MNTVLQNSKELRILWECGSIVHCIIQSFVSYKIRKIITKYNHVWNMLAVVYLHLQKWLKNYNKALKNFIRKACQTSLSFWLANNGANAEVISLFLVVGGLIRPAVLFASSGFNLDTKLLLT